MNRIKRSVENSFSRPRISADTFGWDAQSLGGLRLRQVRRLDQQANVVGQRGLGQALCSVARFSLALILSISFCGVAIPFPDFF